MRLDVLHIYSGTSGISGLYLDSIIKATPFLKQEVIVSYYYPSNYGRRIFYKYSDLSVSNKYNFVTGNIRYFIRSIEFISGLLYAFFYIITHKVKIINYSLISTFKVELYFLKLVKFFSNSEIYITCHDVVPFKNDYTDYTKDLETRNLFFSIADKLIVHNSNSETDLKNFFNINNNKIIRFPFPIMDLSQFPLRDSPIVKDIVTYVFIGHLRNEKGINTLIRAWKKFVNDTKKTKLIIAGNIPKSANFDRSMFKDDSIELVEGYLSDLEYINLIKLSDYVVLPYERGTNSGIPSSVISLKRLTITSDIPMFTENKLIHSTLKFKAGDIDSLVKILNVTFAFSNLEKQKLLDELNNEFINYRLNFNSSIKEAFESVL